LRRSSIPIKFVSSLLGADLRARYGLDGRRDEAPLARKYQQLALAL
jgi:hypothetical protein